MIKRDELFSVIEGILGTELLEKARRVDVVANGMQIKGSSEVDKIALGVTCHREFLEKAVEWGAQVCLFHHGLDPRTHLSTFPTYLQKQLKIALGHNVTIAGYHFALDAHPSLGNNAQIIEKLGATISGPLFEDWGFVGRFETPQRLEAVAIACEKLFKRPVMRFEAGSKTISTIGVVSGAGKPGANHIAEMEDKGVELYISGETSESVPHKLKESRINYFVCGHYATEVFGIKALGSAIEEKVGSNVAVKFIDVPSPI